MDKIDRIGRFYPMEQTFLSEIRTFLSDGWIKLSVLLLAIFVRNFKKQTFLSNNNSQLFKNILGEIVRFCEISRYSVVSKMRNVMIDVDVYLNSFTSNNTKHIKFINE